MKILFIRPIITSRPDLLEEEIVRPFAAAGTEVTARHLDFGPASIENEYDLVYSAPFVLKEAIRGEKDGFDGIVSYCFANPAVEACREAVDIPVLGAGEAAMALASLVGRRIGVVTILPNILPMLHRQLAHYAAAGRLAAIRSANIPVTEIGAMSDVVLERLCEEARICIEKDGADTIVLGCTGFAGFAEKISKRLADCGYNVPVIDPAAASVRMIEAVIASGISSSREAYMYPIKKELRFPREIKEV